MCARLRRGSRRLDLLTSAARIRLKNAQQISEESVIVVGSESPLLSGGGSLSDLSLCLLHGPDSGQPFLCGPQSSGDQR